MYYNHTITSTLRAASHPRVLAQKNPFFAFILINLNTNFFLKIHLNKIRKIPINCKNHNFQNTTPN